MRITCSYFKNLAIVVLFAISSASMAANIRWLQDSAMSNMTDADMEVLRSAARNVLNYGPDGEAKRWENRETGAKGVLTPLRSFEQDGMFCRQLEAFNEVGGASGRSVFIFCQQEDDTWRISSKPAP